MSDLRKIIDEVDSFISSNVYEKLERFEHDIETYQNSLTELTNKKEEIEETISKLKKDVATQEIGKRDLLDNMDLRKIKEMLETLREQYRKLNEKIKGMNYNEIMRKWDQLENEKQTLFRQVGIDASHQSFM